MSLQTGLLQSPGHLWLRLADRAWVDPLDGSFAQETGGRWNPPKSWPTLYFSRDVETARGQILRLLEGTSVNPDDLTDDAYELVALVLPAMRVVDIVTDEGVVDAGLPLTYPCDAAGQLITHAACQRIAQDAHASGADGIEARSALIPVYPLATTELAWWPGAQAPAQVGERVPYGHWRAASVTDSGALFRSASASRHPHGGARSPQRAIPRAATAAGGLRQSAPDLRRHGSRQEGID